MKNVMDDDITKSAVSNHGFGIRHDDDELFTSEELSLDGELRLSQCDASQRHYVDGNLSLSVNGVIAEYGGDITLHLMAGSFSPANNVVIDYNMTTDEARNLGAALIKAADRHNQKVKMIGDDLAEEMWGLP